MTQVSLTVNGERVSAEVEPRTHLADFLRERQRLTGTHLGCEQGVCGACTILIDGAPARSCLAFAVACEGADIRTVEGFDDDPVMARLREAFSIEHALQCGFCTPGMLISAYDIVRRLPEADEKRIRIELSGNLCRCTGYMGIVAAVKRVLAEMPAAERVAARRKAPVPVPRPLTPALSPQAGRGNDRAIPLSPQSRGEGRDEGPVASAAIDQTGLEPGWTRLADAFTADRPPAEVWALFADVKRVAACLPGAVVEETDGTTIKGRMQVKIGPIGAAFAGTATHRRDDAAQTGALEGSGGDQRSNSRARGRVAYRLVPVDGGARTRVELTLDFLLQGMLAQFSRSGLVRDLVGRMVNAFAANLAALLAGNDEAAPAAAELRAGGLLGSALWAWIKRLLGVTP